MTKYEGLTLRRLADKSDPASLDATLPGAPPGRWPTAGLQIEGDPPQLTTISMRYANELIAEGLITGEGRSVVYRPGGPASNPDALTHTFIWWDYLTIGSYRYRVIRQPDKYAARDADDDVTPVDSERYAAGETKVDWFYVLELVE